MDSRRIGDGDNGEQLVYALEEMLDGHLLTVGDTIEIREVPDLEPE